MTEKTTTPRERPLLMSGPLARATLRDVNPKTVTRRLVQPMAGKQREWLTRDLLNKVPHGEMIAGGWQMHHLQAGTTVEGVHIMRNSPLGWIKCPYGVPGDRLWIRETWAHAGDRIVYAADYDEKPAGVDRWRPSLHMLRADSRITLEIVDVRVERLQDITEEDAEREGLEEIAAGVYTNGKEDTRDPVKAFRWLWDSLTDESTSWASNPFVWRIEYRRIKP